MKWTGLNEIREKFLSFFESKGHTRLKSYPLLPQGDNSLLLINSGMAPMKKFFLGQETPPNKRVATCQKCIRTPDIERVGKTSRHGTYFEMLGNFSFGDYFKVEATAWAWEFCTKVMDLPVDRIWISIYQDDDETLDIWTQKVGIPADRIVRLGKEDNFWEIGAGPCGPCSELYFDRGVEHGCDDPNCAVGCECDRFVEFWNLVFSQFDNDGNGTYTLLEKPNIDTGMGLERLACIMQGVDNLFEVDTIANIMKHICTIANVEYKTDEKTDVSLRVITDHVRSTCFMIADGVIASNEGRGYVLRRLLRRAARHGRLLGINKPFLYEVVETVANENKDAYPEVMEQKDYIKTIVLREEESFNKTIGKGFELLTSLIDALDIADMEDDKKILSGEDAFKLYDTYGFPIDLTREILAERNIPIDENQFAVLMNNQRERARTARLSNDTISWSEDKIEVDYAQTEFVGYDSLTSTSKIIAIANEDGNISTAVAGDEIIIVTDKTPFYATSGGQVNDIGNIITKEGTLVEVFDVTKGVKGHYFHTGRVVKGKIEVGDLARFDVQKQHREAVMRNHTAAHLLQKALNVVLGDHVHQAGQLVDDKRLRFDFSHFEAMTKEQIVKVEEIVNSAILSGQPVNIYETDIETAKEKGATALFGEKYGNVVRVVDAGPLSMELCGGTHVDNTAKIGLFKIISESSAAAGVRRIEATTGMGVLNMLNDTISIIYSAASEMKLSNSNELVNKVTSVMSEIKEKNIEIDSLNQKLADSKIAGLVESVQAIAGVNYFSAMISGTKPDALKVMGDKIKEKAPRAVAVIVGIYENKATMLCVCGKIAIENKAHAGKIIAQVAAMTGGKGGGSADRAMAGVVDQFKVDEALAALPQIIENVVTENK